MSKEPDYVLGHSRAELDRLAEQSTFYATATEDLMRRAGIGPGMRVLEIGSGSGDVAILAARLVGANGAVLGIERSPEAVELARARAAAEDLTWCRFVVADVNAFSGEEAFDALVGRLVLMYLPDPAATIRSLVRYLKPGAAVAFQELYVTAATAFPDGPVAEKYVGWIIEAFRRAGVEIDMGPKLYATLREAGLPEPRMFGSMLFTSHVDPLGYTVLAGVVRSLLPLFERFGIATAAELDVDTLVGRLREESASGGRVHVTPPMIGAWSHVPA